MRVQGFWLGAGASYRLPLGGGFGLRPRLGAGFVVAHSSDPITVSAERAGESLSGVVGGAGDTTHTTPFFASADLGIERALGSWRVAVALHAFFIPVPGPASTAGNIDCARVTCTSSVVARERVYGAFLLVMPQLSVTWDSERTR